MGKFNVGDEVVVDNKGYRNSTNGIYYSKYMDEFVGKTFTVSSITNGNSCRLSGCGPWNFDNEWLSRPNKFKGNK